MPNNVGFNFKFVTLTALRDAARAVSYVRTRSFEGKVAYKKISKVCATAEEAALEYARRSARGFEGGGG